MGQRVGRGHAIFLHGCVLGLQQLCFDFVSRDTPHARVSVSYVLETSLLNDRCQLIKDNLDGTFDFHARVSCSSGTYVRTLAEDFGKRLYVGAHLAELRRTRVGDFEITQAITLDQLKLHFAEESLGSVVLPLNAALSRLPFVHLSGEDVRRANHGRDVTVAEADWADGENVKMCDAGEQLIAVGQYDANAKCLHPRVVLAGEK